MTTQQQSTQQRYQQWLAAQSLVVEHDAPYKVAEDAASELLQAMEEDRAYQVGDRTVILRDKGGVRTLLLEDCRGA